MSHQKQKRRARALRRKHEKQVCVHCRLPGATEVTNKKSGRLRAFAHKKCAGAAAARILLNAMGVR